MPKPVNYRETADLWHGAGRLFTGFDQTKARVENDYFGGGVAYLTTDSSDHRVTVGYARSASKNTQTPYVYRCALNARKVFDVDEEYTGKELRAFLKTFKTRDQIESFARYAGLLSKDRALVLSSLTKVLLMDDAEAISLTGAQIFTGLAGGQYRSSTVRQKLITLGYNCLRYNGGFQTASHVAGMSAVKPHNVYIAYDAKDIQIKTIFEVAGLRDREVLIERRV